MAIIFNVRADTRLRLPAPNRWDVLAIPLVLGVLVLFGWGARQMGGPFSVEHLAPIRLDPGALPDYALRTTLRMLLALVASLLFTLVYATLAAKSRRAGLILIPILDVLQSVPILGYISFTFPALIALFPGRIVGAEIAAIFVIFTSQAWNMAFSLYQSLRTVPRDLSEAADIFQLSRWQKFWRLEIPFAMPGLIWNMMMSMSGGWFFVVASEAISVSDKQVLLPGIGSYISVAIDQRNISAVLYAILAMLIVIILYDQLLFRPLVVWASKFKFEETPSPLSPQSWLYDLFRRTRLFQIISKPLGDAIAIGRNWRFGGVQRPSERQSDRRRIVVYTDWAYFIIIGIVAAYAATRTVHYIAAEIGWAELGRVLWLGLLTLIRVMVLIFLAAIIWVPIGVWIGLRPSLAERVQPVAQFLAAFPANLLFPIAVVAILRFHLNADIWVSPLMILGTQWYILFNVIAGATAFPNDLLEAASSFQIHGWAWWRRVMLPGIFPYFLTGAVTASGGSWNASIVAEVLSWGHDKIVAHGIGAYIADVQGKGDFPRIVLGIAVLSLYVTLLNRLFWRPLYNRAARRLRLD